MTDMNHVVPGTLSRVFRKITRMYDYEGPYDSEVVTSNIDDATVVTSELTSGKMHAPVIDLDVPARLVPSSTPGHFHLYLDVPMTLRQQNRILRALMLAGVVEKPFYELSRRRGYTAVRLPWVTKEGVEHAS